MYDARRWATSARNTRPCAQLTKQKRRRLQPLQQDTAHACELTLEEKIDDARGRKGYMTKISTILLNNNNNNNGFLMQIEDLALAYGLRQNLERTEV
jgi:hypothetical protein